MKEYITKFLRSLTGKENIVNHLLIAYLNKNNSPSSHESVKLKTIPLRTDIRTVQEEGSHVKDSKSGPQDLRKKSCLNLLCPPPTPLNYDILVSPPAEVGWSKPSASRSGATCPAPLPLTYGCKGLDPGTRIPLFTLDLLLATGSPAIPVTGQTPHSHGQVAQSSGFRPAGPHL